MNWGWHLFSFSLSNHRRLQACYEFWPIIESLQACRDSGIGGVSIPGISAHLFLSGGPSTSLRLSSSWQTLKGSHQGMETPQNGIISRDVIVKDKSRNKIKRRLHLSLYIIIYLQLTSTIMEKFHISIKGGWIMG